MSDELQFVDGETKSVDSWMFEPDGPPVMFRKTVDAIDIQPLLVQQNACNSTPWRGRDKGCCQITRFAATRRDDGKWDIDREVTSYHRGKSAVAVISADSSVTYIPLFDEIDFNEIDFGEQG